MCKCQCESTIVIDPAQVPFDFAYFYIAESYANGYDTGLFWDANWMPGGPWVYETKTSDPEKVKLAIEAQNHYDDWHKGFNDGLAQRLTNNAHFREWWNANRGTKNYRYTAPMELAA